jgi:hypothetical protein
MREAAKSVSNPIPTRCEINFNISDYPLQDAIQRDKLRQDDSKPFDARRTLRTVRRED